MQKDLPQIKSNILNNNNNQNNYRFLQSYDITLQNLIYQQQQQQDKIKHQKQMPDYNWNYNYFQTQFMLFHSLKTALHFQNLSKINRNQQQKQQQYIKYYNITYKDAPDIKLQDKSHILGQQLLLQLKSNQQYQSQLTKLQYFKIAVKNNQSLIIRVFITMIIYICAAVFKYLSFYKLTQSVYYQEKTKAYLLIIIIGIILLIQTHANKSLLNVIAVFNQRFKHGILYLIFNKIMSISYFTAQKAQLGKIINMFGNDFVRLQNFQWAIFYLSSLPLVFIVSSIIFVKFLGIFGIVCLIIPIILLCIQGLIWKINIIFVYQTNHHKDQRIKLTSQLIEGIKITKAYGWQIAIQQIINKLRKQQAHSFRKSTLITSLQKSISFVSSTLSSLLCFLVIYYIGSVKISVLQIFFILNYMNFYYLMVKYSSVGLNGIAELNVLLSRFCDIMNRKNIQMKKIKYQKKQNKNQKRQQFLNLHEVIKFQNFYGFWDLKKQKAVLENITLSFQKGKLYGMGGKVGSGKSSFLQSILQQFPYYSGSLKIKGKICYVQQQPIIFSRTIKQNIILDKHFDKKKYQEVIYYSFLKQDLKLFHNKDQTLIGQKGITLSGGQKARIALARSLYQQGDIYMFDDPISAVDSKVGRNIFYKTIKQFLKLKTVILSTHQVNYLQQCDQVLILQKGIIKCFNQPQKIKKQLQFLKNSQVSDQDKNFNENINLLQSSQKQQQNHFHELKYQQKIIQDSKKTKTQNFQKAINVNLKSLFNYLIYGKNNCIFLPITLIFFIISQSIKIFYLQSISTYNQQIYSKDQVNYSIQYNKTKKFWLILILCQCGILVFSYFRYVLIYELTFNSNNYIHKDMIHGLVRSPCSFFDINKSGKNINRFSNDLGILDTALIFQIVYVAQNLIAPILIIMNLIKLDFLYTIIEVISLILVFSIFFKFKDSLKQARQLSLKTRDPLLSFTKEYIDGIIINTLYSSKDKQKDSFCKLSDASFRTNLPGYHITKILQLYPNYVTGVTLMVGLSLAVHFSSAQKAGQFCLIAFFLQFNFLNLGLAIRFLSQLFSFLVSYQRCLEFVNLQSQKQLYSKYDYQNDITNINGKSNLEKVQEIKILNLSLKYKQSLPLVLKDISFCVKRNQKVGIVGRTGAGKSSIFQCLLRLYQPQFTSNYFLGNYDALKMGLHTLRHSIAIIPQTPFLFKGTIQQNLDPFQQKSDQDIRAGLQKVKLLQYIKQLPQGLQTIISNNSQVFSVGQKQLLCLSRALIKKSNIFLLDEATSNVDMNTDEILQKVLRQQCSQSIIITIAHRLKTIADYDKVVVMDKGKIIQFGIPYQLLLNKGLFYEMVKNTGKSQLSIYQYAEKRYLQIMNKNKNE